ncbi:hypothetical protein OCT63_18910 [Vibrio sp. RW]|uniref:hypothetical protein n=1 Tax=Vibrio sp. RW TaxID=2998833 RepID=UPI0022CD3CAA|nr:hypothetical protein [Vibrio sp. RW]MDA0146297.1 hypothetical protein [Vibrio sp. RW]
MKRLILSSLSTAILLAGCGGDSDNGTSTIQSATYQAIDGYLQFAEMYADRDGDYIPDNDEYLGLTDATGSLTIDEASQYRILVKVVAGQTVDSDTGMAIESKTLVASPGSRYITPFSTLADLNNKFINDLAAELGVDAELLDSDFIAASSSNTQAKLIRTLARSKMPYIGETIQDSQANIDTLQLVTENFATYLNEHVTDFDNITLEIDINGDIYQKRTSDSYSIELARTKWVNSKWDDMILCYGQASADKLVFSNCDMSQMAVVDQKTGQILQREYFDNYNGMNSWYLDNERIVIESNDDSVDIFNMQFEQLTNETPSSVFYEQAHNSGFAVFGEHPVLEQAISNGQLYPYPVQDDRAGADFSVYDPTGHTYRIQTDGEVDDRDAPTKERLASLVISDYLLNENAKPVANSDIMITWLGGSIFSAQIDVDGDKYVADAPSTWYTFDASTGKLTKLGEFYDGKFYRGLDETTVSHYSPVRTYQEFPPADTNKPDYNEIHHWRQISLRDGSLMSELTMKK